MESGKPRKIRTALRQRLSYRFILVTGISVLLITAVLVIYFQFSQNEISKANSLQVPSGGQLPVDMVVTEKIMINNDTLSIQGNRYKIAKPLNR